ncbi:hypothetical protein BGX27_009735 [Mortierella sp. AM989]|nr:hypothetical protein BGX27_009735 [Mortierella sp. AM989]
MIATVVSPGSIPEFVHPPVPGESHDFYGDTHLNSIKLPAPVDIHSPSISTRSHSTQFLDPLAFTDVLNNSSNNNISIPHERCESVRDLASGVNLVEGAEHTESSSDDILWARLVEGCINGQPELVQEILTQSPKLKDSIDSISSATGMNPLHFAASRGHEEIVRILIDHAGAGVEVQDREGETALLKASYSGYFPIVCFLLKRGANVHQRDKDGWTALHNASSKGFIDIAQVLLEKGEADINARSKMGHTPLINAASKGDVAMVLYFLNHARADLLLKNTFSEMAYDVAAANSEAYLCGILQSSEKQWWKNENIEDQVYDPLVIHSTILQIVHENQRATSSFPLSLMAPKFSASALAQQDLCGPWSLPNGRPSTKDDVHLPLITNSGTSNSRANMQRGWFWLTEWVIDKTDPTVDSEGWQYGKSLTEANQQWSAIPPTSGSNWVRRRKWIRVMKKRVDLLNTSGDPLMISDSGQSQYQELAGNYVKRAKLALRPDDGFLDTAQELRRHRQAIQILLYGIKVDKDVTSKQAASALIGEYLQHAEELAESIEQQEMEYASFHQLEAPRPQIASRSSEGSVGSTNELRSLTLQKSRPFVLDTLEGLIHAQNGGDAEDRSGDSSEGSFASATNILDTYGSLPEDNVPVDIEEIVQEHSVPEAESIQEQNEEEPEEQSAVEQSVTEQRTSTGAELSVIRANGDQDLNTVLEAVSLETPVENQMSIIGDTTANIPIITPDSQQQVPEVAITGTSPAALQADPFPMARLTRSPRPTNPSSSSSPASAQSPNSFSSSYPGQKNASPTSIPANRTRSGHENAQQTEIDADGLSGTTDFPRQFSSSFPTPSSFTNQARTSSSLLEAKWESDHKAIECRECNRKFSLWLRRHHCRRCGHVVCDRCSSRRAMLHPSMVVYDPTSSEAYLNHQALARRGTLQSYRVCDSCYATLGPSRPLSLGSTSGSGSSTGQSSSGSQLQHQRVYHGQSFTHSINHNPYKPPQNDGGLGVYLHSSGYAPELTSHSSSRSSSSSNLQSTPMARNASSSSLMSECPVCGAVLAGLEGGKAAQEAHVQECLEGKPGQGSGPVRYVGKLAMIKNADRIDPLMALLSDILFYWLFIEQCINYPQTHRLLIKNAQFASKSLLQVCIVY